MEYLQYDGKKWGWLKNLEVLNLVINGIPSIHHGCQRFIRNIKF